MLSKSNLSFIRSLQQKKFRQEHGCFVAEGDKLAGEILRSDWSVKQVCGSNSWIGRNRELLEDVEQVTEVSEAEMGRMSGLVTPQDVLCVVEIPDRSFSPDDCLEGFTIILDGVRDPGNLGTIIRVADWYGVRRIVCSMDSAEVWNPKVVQASMGSLLRVKVMRSELSGFLTQLQKLAGGKMPVYGTVLNGENIYKTVFSGKGVIITGNESNGISDEILKQVTHKLTIPAADAENSPESLNAAIATAVVLSEACRDIFR